MQESTQVGAEQAYYRQTECDHFFILPKMTMVIMLNVCVESHALRNNWHIVYFKYLVIGNKLLPISIEFFQGK